MRSRRSGGSKRSSAFIAPRARFAASTGAASWPIPRSSCSISSVAPRRSAPPPGGAFDLPVQPLFELHARHFARPGAAPDGPGARRIEAALARVDHRSIDATSRSIRFARPGMAITANGIAQGYLTDRIADFLRDRGAGHVLVDLGEIRATGPRADGRPWRIALGGRTTGLVDGAIATSDPAGTAFSPDGRQHHLLDPGTGRPAGDALRVTVMAPDATLADALSTTYAVAAPPIIERMKALFPQASLLTAARSRPGTLPDAAGS